MLSSEAERLVESIRPMKIEDIGSKEWTRQHQGLERLNMEVRFQIFFAVRVMIDSPAFARRRCVFLIILFFIISLDVD